MDKEEKEKEEDIDKEEKEKEEDMALESAQLAS